MPFTPMPLVLRRAPFDDSDWLFELKIDGYRALAYVEPDGVTLVSRTGHVFRQFDALRADLRRELGVRRAVLDGEIACLDPHGRSQFLDLHLRRGCPIFAAFDVLTHGARDLRSWPLERRKARLRTLVPTAATSILYVQHVERTGVALFRAACRRDLEGIVAKPRGSAYDPTRPWLKIKNPDYSQKAGRAELFLRR